MSDRLAALQGFVAAAGWGAADRRPLAGDASFRRYDRLIAGDGARAVLMDAPPPQEDVRPFIGVDRHLVGLGLSAPRLLAADVADGFLLLEDLGDDSYTRLLAEGRGDQATLYEAAVDVLAALRGAPAPAPVPFSRGDWAIAAYGERAFSGGPSLVVDWHAPALGLALDEAAAQAFRAIWAELWRALPRETATIMLRDYHADNLLWLPERRGLARVGLLDFQDATMGPPAYDLVSLLEDARRDVPPALAAELKARYAMAAAARDPGFDRAAFEAAYAILGAQRNSRIAGVFVRLWRRDGKPRYLDFLPRVWAHLERNLRHPLMAPLAAWYDTHLPGEALRHGIRERAA